MPLPSLYCVLYPIEDVNGVKLIVVVDKCSCANFSNGMLLFVVNKLFMFTLLNYHSCVVMTANTPTTEGILQSCKFAVALSTYY